MEVANRISQKNSANLARILGDRSPFSSFGSDLEGVAKQVTWQKRRYGKKDRLYRQGDETSLTHYVAEGAVGLVTYDQSDSEKTTLDRVVTKGRWLGTAETLIGENEYLTDAMVLNNKTRLITMSTPFFRQLYNMETALRENVAEDLAQGQKDLYKRFSEGGSAEERLKILFLDYGPAIFSDPDDPGRVRVHISQEVLGSLIGASRESVCRSIVDLVGEGVLEKKGKSFYVAGSPRLEGQTY